MMVMTPGTSAAVKCFYALLATVLVCTQRPRRTSYFCYKFEKVSEFQYYPTMRPQGSRGTSEEHALADP